MRKFILSALALLPAAAFASSIFDGTWTARIDSVKVTGKPDVYVIANGTYSCPSCDPPLSNVPADGAWHKITGHAYYDEIMVHVVDPKTVEISQRLGGKLSGVDTLQLSADGNAFTGKFTGYQGAKPVTGEYTEKRVAAGPAGSHALSGSWLQDQMSSANDAMRKVAYAMTADQFTMEANGQSYAAKFDGKQYPVVGDPGQTRVTLKKIDDRNVEETDYRQGKVVDEVRLAAAADGKTILVTDKDLAHGQTSTIILDKQP
jgi:hypothetical protein